MGTRRRARELAIQILYYLEYSPGEPEKAFDLICENFSSPDAVKEFSRFLVLGVCRNREKIDQAIQKASRNWRLDRMARVDRNILRIGTYEVLFMEDIPSKVSIDEAVELGKRFGTDESGAFINGILDHIHNQKNDETANTE